MSDFFASATSTYLIIIILATLAFLSRLKPVYRETVPPKLLGWRFFLSPPKRKGVKYTFRKLVVGWRLKYFVNDKPVYGLVIELETYEHTVQSFFRGKMLVKQIP